MVLPRKKIERIVVIQTAFLGDIVLLTAFLHSLRKAFPRAQLHVVTTAIGAAILENFPFPLKITIFAKRGKDAGLPGLYKKIREVRAWKPQAVFCVHRSFRSALFARGLSKEVWGFKDSPGSIFYKGKVSRAGHLYEGQKNLALLNAYLASREEPPLEDSIQPVLGFSKDDEVEAQKLLRGYSKFVALAPSSVWATKRWPAENFSVLALRLAREQNIACVIVGGKDSMDIAIAEKVAAEFLKQAAPNERGFAPLNLAGKTNLGVLKAVIARAKIVVANDSAPLHIATAVKVPVLGIFGPTTQELGFFPHSIESAVAQVDNLSCRPCGLHGHHICPQKHFRCMKDLDSQKVFDEAKKLLCL